jgi:hypothetical protein
MSALTDALQTRSTGSRCMRLDYSCLTASIGGYSVEEMIIMLERDLPYLWREAYERDGARRTSIVRIQGNSFDYIYDNYSYLESTGVVPYDSIVEDRLVAVLGRSSPSVKPRDDYRLRGWVGPTETTYGKRYDKGHFIAHSIGGIVDRSEMNVFVQRRDLNRGWSAEGKLYRAMEKYCVAHSGTFCFIRPLYEDQTSKPSFLEFGILKNTGELWLECFDNQ